MSSTYQLVILCIFIYVSTFLGLKIWHSKIRVPRRLEFIKRYHFGTSLKNKIAEEYPKLSSYDIDIVLDGLKQFFIVAYLAKGRRIGMPSVIVDAAWHHFILHTIDYHNFCKKAFGKLFNHTPNSSIENPKDIAIELRCTWQIACELENVNPKHPTRIPLLFGLDSRLKIENGNYYELLENELRFGEKKGSPTAETAYPVSLCSGCAGTTQASEIGCTGGSGCGGGGCSGG